MSALVNSFSLDEQPTSLPAWLHLQAQRRGGQVALRHKRLGVWRQWSWQEAYSEVLRLAGLLHVQGVRPGDCLVLLTHPRPEALLLSLAVQWLGGIAVPLELEQTDNDLRRVVQELKPRFVFAAGQSEVDRLLDAGVEDHASLLVYADIRGLRHYQQALLQHYEHLLVVATALEGPALARSRDIAFRFVRSVSGTGLDGLIAQQFTHLDLLAEGRRVIEVELLNHREEALAARSFATSGHVRYLLAPWLQAGFRLNFPENLDTRDQDRRALGPTLVAGTRDTYGRLLQVFESRRPPAGSWRRSLLEWGLRDNGPWALQVLRELLVLRPLRDVLGFGRAHSPLLVGAALDIETAHFFRAIGVTVRHWPDEEQWRAVAQLPAPGLHDQGQIFSAGLPAAWGQAPA